MNTALHRKRRGIIRNAAVLLLLICFVFSGVPLSAGASSDEEGGGLAAIAEQLTTLTNGSVFDTASTGSPRRKGRRGRKRSRRKKSRRRGGRKHRGRKGRSRHRRRRR